jgi:lipopolysaccharide biosynthesis glycosyltransferase
MLKLSNTLKKPEAKDLIHVVLAVCDPKGTYSRHAGVVMTSMFEHTKSLVRVHILHDDTLTDDNRRRFLRTAEKFGQEVYFVDAAESFTKVNRNSVLDKLSRKLTRGTIFRLLVPNLINAEKVIYMDCDIAVNTDISELWYVPLRSANCSLAAVIDISGYWKKILERVHMAYIWDLAWDKYFNAGILLMDLERIRQEHDFITEAKTFFERFTLLCEHLDQDFLNVVFKGKVFFLEERFNRIKDIDNNINDSILHFAGRKPWQFLRNSARDKLYWETFMRSEWNDQWFDALRELCVTQHSRSSDCVGHLMKKFTENFFHTFTLSLPKRLKICSMAVSKFGHSIRKSIMRKIAKQGS